MPRIIEGICEFCGIEASSCPHHKNTIQKHQAHKEKPNVYRDYNIDVNKKDYGIDHIIADIVIPHHNCHDHLKECLDRLPNTIFNIIIVSGGTFAENCNKGAKLAVTDNIIFMNDDTLPVPEYLIDMCNMEHDIVSAAQQIPDIGSEIYKGVGFFLHDGSLKAKLTHVESDIHIPNGFLFMVRRSVWEDLGGFDERFKNGGEDSDIFMRAIEKKYSIGYFEKPIIHKHSQSHERLKFSRENQDLLETKWPRYKVMSMFNLKESPMKILVATNHLANFAGSETFTYTISKELIRRGHEVDVFTLNEGTVSNMLPTVKQPKDEYDLILINHNTMVKALKDIRGHKIQTCHGIYPALEQPEGGCKNYVAISDEVRVHLDTLGFDNTLIHNGVDLERFKSIREPHENVKNVLCMCKGEEAAKKVKAACEKIGAEFKWIKDRPETEQFMNWADVVVTLGRGAMEAMACGRAVLIYDHRHYMDQGYCDGVVNADTFQMLLKHNFSGRAHKKDASINDLVNKLTNIIPVHDGKVNRVLAEQHFDVKKQIGKYISLCQSNSWGS